MPRVNSSDRGARHSREHASGATGCKKYIPLRKLKLLISEARKFIYIAVPKTGSTSIESHLVSLDPTIQRNRVPQPNGAWASVHKHARAVDVQSKMGTLMREYTVVAFIRDPLSTVVSKYYYYRLGRGAQRARLLKFTKQLNQTRLRVLSKMILPLRAWVRLYPYSMTHEFLLDDQKNMLVDALGNFENLQEEFERIFSGFGFAPSELKLPTTNKSEYSAERHTNDDLLKKIVARKSSLDMRIFDDLVPEARSVSAERVIDN